MNNERRKIIKAAAVLLDEANAKVEEAMQLLTDAADEEREYYDNMPESLQNGEKGERASAAADALDTARDNCENIMGDISSAIDEIGSADA